MSRLNFALFLLFALHMSSCAPTPSKVSPSTEQTITVMTFNVENLFDIVDDAGKSDETYLPLDLKQSPEHKAKCQGYRFEKWKNQCLHWDWSEKNLLIKLGRLAQPIKWVRQGQGPDVIVFQEVENINVLTRLRDEKLQGMNYPHIILIEGKDKRGIDIAILSRFPLTNPAQLHPLSFKGFSKDRVEDTRGILQADLKLPNGDILTVFGVHFPAPFHPVEMREQAFQGLNKLRQDLPKDRLVIAAGDFNVPSDEDKKTNIVDRHTKNRWLVSHRIGCQECPGSNYYAPKTSWSFLDMILFSKSFEEKSSNWRVLPSSVRLVNQAAEQKTNEGYPKSFEMPEATGTSDHWPIAVDLVRVPATL